MEFLTHNDRYFVKLYKDEDLFSCLEKLADQESFKVANLNGIGALKDVELGFYHLDKKEYHRKTFEGEYELLSMVGNCSLLKGKPFFHIHASLSGEDFSCFGGHLFGAKVAVTCEIELRTFPIEIERLPDEEVGLNLLSMCKI